MEESLHVTDLQLHKMADQTVWSISTSTKSGKKLHKMSRDRRFMQFSAKITPKTLVSGARSAPARKYKGLSKAKQSKIL